jgi:hypothetical protein
VSDPENALRALLKATDPFERIYLINQPLNPPDDRPVRDFVPGAWPDMGQLRQLLDAADSARKLLKVRRP